MKEKVIIIEDDPNRKSCLGMLSALCGVCVSILFLLNLSGGFLEIPDNLPVIGNLDEVGVTWFLLVCLRYLGLDLMPFARLAARKEPTAEPER